MKRSILGLVLSGGRSRRLGRDKAQLSFHDGTNQLDYMLSLLDTFCENLAISCRSSQIEDRASRFDAALIYDAEGIVGPVAGVLAGLKYAGGGAVLTVACDMPLLDPASLLKLLSLRNPEKLATCFIARDGKPEPMCAVYEAACLPALEEWVAKGDFSLRRFLEKSGVERITLKESQLLASVNTFDDVEAVRKRLAR
ncbi:MAG: molybdenum cofactor guanylyltransferase [Opitutaceae bacterium]|nr:molybdenum cofactor guanylyltransferase [Opitutaceae bacterium]